LQKTVLYFFKKFKKYEQITQSSLNTEKYNAYFKKYLQTHAKEIIRLYISMKEFRLTIGV
jgi:hypothetical protein